MKAENTHLTIGSTDTKEKSLNVCNMSGHKYRQPLEEATGQGRAGDVKVERQLRKRKTESLGH